MGIGTIQEMVETHHLPVYVKIAKVYENHYEVGREYTMKSDESSHEAILISMNKIRYGDIPPMAIALAGFSKSRTEAEMVIQKTGPSWNEDTMVYLLSFIRKDVAMAFVEQTVQIDHLEDD